jgi:hypothetical protein
MSTWSDEEVTKYIFDHFTVKHVNDDRKPAVGEDRDNNYVGWKLNYRFKHAELLRRLPLLYRFHSLKILQFFLLDLIPGQKKIDRRIDHTGTNQDASTFKDIILNTSIEEWEQNFDEKFVYIARQQSHLPCMKWLLDTYPELTLSHFLVTNYLLSNIDMDKEEDGDRLIWSKGANSFYYNTDNVDHINNSVQAIIFLISRAKTKEDFFILRSFFNYNVYGDEMINRILIFERIKKSKGNGKSKSKSILEKLSSKSESKFIEKFQRFNSELDLSMDILGQHFQHCRSIILLILTF